jgi:hypothetical protein
MALKAMTPAAAPPVTKAEFVKGGGAKVLPVPRAGRVKKGDDPSAYAINTLLYGPYGSGKTSSAAALLKLGYKVYFVVTDIGANGIVAVKMELKKAGLSHLASNYRILEIADYKEMEEFIKEPASFDPEFYEFATDFLFWDGFGYFQQTDMMAKAGEMILEQNDINEGKKEVSELRESGLKFELADYQVLRNMTVRVVKGFCGIHNKKTGQLIHKVFTCQESLKSKGADQGGGFKEGSQPLLTGAGGVLTCGAFDLIIKTSKDPYKYRIGGDKNSATKKRGFSLPDEMDADFEKVWKTVVEDLDIKAGATDPANIAPVLVANE